MTNLINIQVTYGNREKQKVIDLKVKPTTTILQAIEGSNITYDFPEIDLDNLCVGIYSKIKPLDYIVKEGDRIEIYRELEVTKKINKTTNLKVEI